MGSPTPKRPARSVKEERNHLLGIVHALDDPATSRAYGPGSLRARVRQPLSSCSTTDKPRWVPSPDHEGGITMSADTGSGVGILMWPQGRRNRAAAHCNRARRGVGWT